MEQFGTIVAVMAFMAFIALSMAWRGTRSESMMAQWARTNGLTLLSEERCWFFKGPFFWTSGKGQMIYYVTVRDPSGRTRHAWVRCGGYFLGMLSDNMDVKWED
jgi:hypothetical protein